MLVRRSSGSVSLVAIDRDALLNSLEDIAGRIRSDNPEVCDIRLFGSIARGEETGISDADILIVVESSDSPAVLRSVKFMKYFNIEVPVDILVYTKDEFNRLLEGGNAFLRKISKEGISLL